MKRMPRLYRYVDRLFEHPLVFNLNQALLDGGKKRRIEHFLAGLPYASVLDVGCGTGNWAPLARGVYLGVDTSPSFIAACRRRYRHDPQKRFLLADATTLDLSETFDLALLVSVLHHLSDEEVRRLLARVARATRHLFVLDLYPIPENPIARWLYAMDRGQYIRTPKGQKRLLLAHGALRLVKEGDYFCPNRLYRHTLFLFESEAGRV